MEWEVIQRGLTALFICYLEGYPLEIFLGINKDRGLLSSFSFTTVNGLNISSVTMTLLDGSADHDIVVE
jgi:hypothetical protein